MEWFARVFLLSLALLPLGARAQSVPAPRADTVLRRPAILRLPHNRFVAQYDSRYSIINRHFTTINGLKLGIEFKSRFRTGAAIYFLSTGVPTRRAAPENAAEGAEAELRFRYLAAYAGYALLETKRWEISANLQLGMGSAYVIYENFDGDLDKTPRDFLGVVEPAMAAQLRVFRWAGVGTGVGWRQPVFVPAAIQKELNGPVFYLRANVFLGELIKVMKDKEPLFTQANMRRD
ncbi:hypothetical protein [Hymenobacter antarcticus]|uniref:Outer membrane protein beta-barrel domain-containing protein n=1 Tax=Hymenobacter antarcticus TaxID=486270 RepID=A0ABP7PEW1_9BACT